MSKRLDNKIRNKSIGMRTAISLSWRDPIKRIERCKKISLALMGNHCRGIGWHHSIKTRKKIGQGHLGLSHPAWNRGLTKETDMRVKKYIMNSAKSRMGKIYPYMYDLAHYLRKSRNTKPELKMKELLESLGIEYEFQKRIGNGTADFYIPLRNLVIEVDGEYWHNYPYGTEKDKSRNLELKRLGYNVVRVWAKDVLNCNFRLP